MILTPLQKLPDNMGDLGKIIECLPKKQKIAQSGQTNSNLYYTKSKWFFSVSILKKPLLIYISADVKPT